MKRTSWKNLQVSVAAPANMVNTPRSLKRAGRDEDALIGQVLAARYMIESLVAEGGMASIYVARRTNISDQVAIKVIDLSKSDRSTTILKRFQREAAAAATIIHPNVVTVHDFGVQENLAYLVMELLAGPPLAHELRVNGYFPLTRVVKIFQQICDGVAAAHKTGVIHRDLKPSNIIFKLENCEDDLIKVADFGIAKPMPNQSSEERLTAANVTLGTPEYMSPEQCLGEKIGFPLDQRSDIYSLGILLYELLTGRVPFTNPIFSATIVQHAVAMPTRPSRVNPSISPAIDTVVLKALEKNPEQRYSSVLEFAAEFTQACENFSQNNVANISTRASIAQRDTSTAISPEIAFPFANNIATATERFVGRKEELRRLSERFLSVKNGSNSTVVITGEPGSGKTTLVHQFQQLVDPAEMLFLKGKFYEQGSDGPYRPYLDGLRSLLPLLPDSKMRVEIEPLREELLSSLEAVDEMINNKISKGRVLEEQIKYRTFEMLAQIYLMISEQLPITLFLDDLHWADSLSLEFLAYLARNSQPARILIIGTSRSQELLDDKFAIKTWLRRFSQYSGFEQLRLTPLTETEVASYISSFFGNIQLPDSTLTRLVEISGGNPYFLGEILRQLIQDEKIIWTGKEWRCANLDQLNLPDSILELVELNLLRLSREMIETLMSAAVIGERFSLKLLQAVSDLPKDRLLNIIDNSLRESIIRDIDFTGDDDYFLFHHSTLRQVLYQRLDHSRRVSLHALIGKSLENRERFKATDGELAYHMLQGEQFNKALFHCVMAGESAQSIFAVEEALKYYTWAETSLTKMLELGEQPKYGIAWLANYRLCYGTVLMHIGKNDDALQQFQLGLNLNKRVGLRPFEGKIWCAMGELCWSRGQYQQALNFCQTGLRLLSAMDDREGLSHLFAVMGDIHFSQGSFDQAVDFYQQSLTLSREIGNRSDEGEALRRIGSIMGCRRQARSALDYLDQALAIARTIGNRQSEWLVIMLIGNIYLEQGELVCAAGYYRHARQIARAIGRRRGECRIAVNIGEVLRQQGDLEAAKESFNEAREIAIEIEDREIEGHTLSNLGLLYQDLGELELAMLSFQQALEIFNSINYHSNVESEALCGIAKILVQQNRLIESRDYFIRAINSARDLELWLAVIENLRALADCEYKLGNIAASRDHLSEALIILNANVCKTFDENKQHQSLRAELEQELSELTS